jgi:hypothetical protein
MFDFTWDFQQPTANPDGTALRRDNLKVYPAALDVSDALDVRLDQLEFRRSTYGIKAHGNCSGLRIGTIRDGSLIQGFDLQQVNPNSATGRSIIVDTYDHGTYGRLDRAELVAIHDDGVTEGLTIGPCLTPVSFGNVMLHRALYRNFSATDNGNPVTIDNLAITGVSGRFVLENGLVEIGTASSSTPDNRWAHISNQNGVLRIAAINLFLRDTDRNDGALLECTGGHTTVLGGRFRIPANTAGAQIKGPGFLNVSNVWVQCGQIGRGVAMIRQVGPLGRLVVNNCYPDDRGAAAGPFDCFVQVQNDDHHVISHNRFVNWAMATPDTNEYGIYGPNQSVGNAVQASNLYVQDVAHKQFTGVITDDGRAVIYTKVAGFQDRMISAVCGFDIGNGGRQAMQLDVYDANYLYFKGGVAGRYFCCWVTYSN